MKKHHSEDNEIMYRNFSESFANTIISREFDRALQYFAPWLQNEFSTEDFRKTIENELQEMNKIWEIEQIIYPESFEISTNPCSFSELKKIVKFPKELTDENFRQWMVIQFLPDEEDERIEFDGWFDLWLAIVELNGELRIGHFEIKEVD
jgi:HD superfamily phosphohydrolase